MSDITQDLEKQQRASNDFEPVNTKVDEPVDVVYLNGVAYKRADLKNPSSGEWTTGVHPRPARRMGNPVPIGIVGIGVCAFVLSMVLLEARSLPVDPTVLAGPAILFGGVIEAVAGFWCLTVENTFAATTLCSYAGFWLGLGAILTPGWGLTTNYTAYQLNSLLGFYITAFGLFSFLMWLCTFKATYPTFLFFFFLWVFLICLGISYFIVSTGWRKVSGVFGLLATFDGLFMVYLANATPQTSYLYLPNDLFLFGSQRI